jgi:hypothetical protein
LHRSCVPDAPAAVKGASPGIPIERQAEDVFTTDGEMKKSRIEETIFGDVFVWWTPDEYIAKRGFRNPDLH